MNILTEIIECTDCRSVDRVIENNILKLDKRDRNRITQFANNAKRRIIRLNAEKKKSFIDLLN